MSKKQKLSNNILDHSNKWNWRGILFYFLCAILLGIFIFYEFLNGWVLLALLALLFILLLVLPYKKQLLKMKLNQQQRDEAAENILRNIMSDNSVPDFLLYLRPFKSTKKLGTVEQKHRAEQAAIWEPLSSADLPAELAHGDLESLLSDEFWPPPVLGLGQPGEHFGVGRLPVSESHWQDIVLRLIGQADSIIVVPSHQEGTLWEIEQLISQQLIYKCIFFIEPSGHDDDWLLTHQAMQKLGLHLPTDIHNDTDKRYIGSLFKCFREQAVSIRIDIGYTLKSSVDKVKIDSEIIRSLCSKQCHNAMLDQIVRNNNKTMMIPPTNKIQITGQVYRN